MTSPRTPWLATALFLAAGCAGASRTPAPAAAAPEAPAAVRDTGRYAVTAADVRFMSTMIAHHAQALEMARLAPTRAGSNPVRILAARILNSQEDEIATLQQWLRDHGQPVPEPHPTAHHDHPPMAGMLTPAQMRQLEEARGTEFDRLFLTLMIQHHRGAIEMVNELLGARGAAQNETVFKLAADINVDQATEIARMQRMLADLLFQPTTP